jgi:hypothetical protein
MPLRTGLFQEIHVEVALGREHSGQYRARRFIRFTKDVALGKWVMTPNHTEGSCCAHRSRGPPYALVAKTPDAALGGDKRIGRSLR